MRYVKIGAFALVLLLFAAAVFLMVADRLGQPAPPDPAGLIAKAAQYRVRIERDNFGVPHIVGPRDADVAFGMAFASSESGKRSMPSMKATSRPICGKCWKLMPTA